MQVKLLDVRLTFPNIWEAKAANPQATAKYSAAFLFAPGHPAEKLLQKAMSDVAKEKWAAKAGEVFKGLKAGDKLAIHDGATKSKYAGYEGNLFVNASNSLRPTIIDGQKQPLTINDGKPYSGCYVNAIVELWAQDNQYGQRINASLMGIQFVRDGERLAGATVASEDDFEEVPLEDGLGDMMGDDDSADDILS